MLRGVELKLFNCGTLNTDIHTINVWESINYPTFNPIASTLVGSYVANGDDLNCNSVTAIVILANANANFRAYYIEFKFEQGDSNTDIFIAEARFSNTTITIPNDVTSSPPSPAVTSTPQQPSPSSIIISTFVPMMSSMDSTLFSSPVVTVTTVPIQKTSSSYRLSSTMQLTPMPTPTATPIDFTDFLTDPPTDTVPPTTDPPPGSSDPQLGAIVGPLVGVIVVLIIIIVTVLL